MSLDKSSGAIGDALSDAEYAELEKLETTISKGLDTFVEVGNALAEIRDRRLYRQYHPSFAAYCEEQWEMGKSQAYRLIEAAEVVNDLADEVSPIGDTDSPAGEVPLPATESQARALKDVAPEKRAETMREAAKDGPPTAPKIRTAGAAIDPALKLRQEQEEARAKARAEREAIAKAAKEDAERTMANRIAERRQHDPRVRAEHIAQTVRGFLLSDAHTLLDIHPAEAAESLAIGDETSAIADAQRLASWLTDFADYVANGPDNVTDLRSVQ
jgi:hypothetical protein